MTNEQLVLAYQSGNEDALNMLIGKNLPLVKSLANDLANKHYLSATFDFDDAVSVGMANLAKCAKGFKPEMKLKFSTYSVTGMYREMAREALYHRFSVKFPAGMMHDLFLYERLCETLEGGRLNPDFEKFYQAECTYTKGVSRIEEASNNFLVTVRLEDMPWRKKADQETALFDAIEDVSAADPIHESHLSAMNDALDKLLSSLSEKEKDVIHMRFGLGGTQQLTLEAISKIMGLSKERVRQIEIKAMEKLRNSENIGALRAYLEEAKKD